MAVTIPVALSTVLSILNITNVNKSNKRTEFFEHHKTTVLLYLQRHTTEDDYQASTSEITDSNLLRKNSFTMAYSFLILHSTIEFINLNTQGEGIVASTGIDDLQTKLLSTSTIEQKKAILEQRALNLLKPYLNPEGLDRLITLTKKPRKSFRATII